MKVGGWEADAERCRRGTGDMARSWLDAFGKRLITWETFRGWFMVETCFVLDGRPPVFGIPDELRLRDEWTVTVPPLTSMDSDDRFKDEGFGSGVILVPAFYQQRFQCNPVVGHGRRGNMCARFKAPGSLWNEIPKNGQTEANTTDNQLILNLIPPKTKPQTNTTVSGLVLNILSQNTVIYEMMNSIRKGVTSMKMMDQWMHMRIFKYNTLKYCWTQKHSETL